MGIVNVTPDSFGDSSSMRDHGEAIERALRLEANGADLIDVGGESTRPGADPIDAEQELARILPVVRGLCRQARVPVSIDTYKAGVARAAVEAGAVLINDISGLRFDPELARVAAETGAALVLMHSRGRPKTMNEEAVYGDVVADVIRELRDAIARATAHGVDRAAIVLDPGIGFAKRAPHSYGVLARLPEMAAALDRPLLVGPSRKSFLREAVGDRPASDRDWGTAAAVTAAVLNGAHIVRVHAVEAMAQVVRVAEQIRRAAAIAES
jgi:dihydropteroate synthase